MEARTRNVEVEQTGWPPEHSQALREFHAKGMSYSEIAKALNARFAASYTRNAVLGRAKRMGFGDSDEKRAEKAMLERMLRERISRSGSSESRMSDTRPAGVILSGFRPPKLPRVNAEPAKLRCVEVSPRHLALIELERNDCRYPYGGDEEGEAITFCGHPRRKGSSYCGPHFHLSRAPVIPPERAVSTAPLRLVERNEIFERATETDPHGTNETKEAVRSRESA
jgi:hypothetical protein